MPNDDWTTAELKLLLDEHDRYWQAVHSGLERRLATLNELRAEVTTDREQYLRLDVYDSKHTILENRMLVTERWQSRATGVAVVLIAMSTVFGAIIGVLLTQLFK